MPNHDVKVGDVVHVRGVVMHVDTMDAGFPYQIKFDHDASQAFWFRPSDIVHVESRPLKVGDRVRWFNYGAKYDARVLALDGKYAWVRTEHGDCATTKADELERIPNTCGND